MCSVDVTRKATFSILFVNRVQTLHTWKRGEMHTKFWLDFREVGWQGVNCIHMDQDMNQWWVLVHTVMNIRVP